MPKTKTNSTQNRAWRMAASRRMLMVAFALLFAGVGTYLLLKSHADTLGDIPVAADYSGDGKADLAVWRPSNGTWYVSSNLSGNVTQSAQWGLSGDDPVVGDYNGDGKSDYAVWRPSNGIWYVKGIATIQYGQSGDIPAPADYNGDGKTDIAVWRPSDCSYYIRNLGTPKVSGINNCTDFGYVPYPSDKLGGTGAAFPVLYQQATGTWTTLPWRGGSATGNVYGTKDDRAVPAKYQGSGASAYSVFAIFRPSDGTWHISNGCCNTAAVVQYGQAGDIPQPTDYNGDGAADIAVFRPSTATWYLRGIKTVKFGDPR